jgi:Fe-S cluster biogenesis protein NfuA
MTKPVVRAERAEKRLLVRILGSLRTEQMAQLAQDGGSVVLVEAFERRRRRLRCRFQGARALPASPSEMTGRLAH